MGKCKSMSNICKFMKKVKVKLDGKGENWRLDECKMRNSCN